MFSFICLGLHNYIDTIIKLHLFLRYMDNGIVALSPFIDIKFFEDSLQSMNRNISFTFEEAVVSVNEIGDWCQLLNYLDVNVIG